MRSIVGKFILMCALTASVGMLGTGFVAAQGKKDQNKESKAEKAKEAKAEKAKEAKAVTTFELYKDNAGEFRFRMKHDDAVLAMASKGYKTRADCEKVIEIIKRDAAKAKVEDESK